MKYEGTNRLMLITHQTDKLDEPAEARLFLEGGGTWVQFRKKEGLTEPLAATLARICGQYVRRHPAGGLARGVVYRPRPLPLYGDEATPQPHAGPGGLPAHPRAMPRGGYPAPGLCHRRYRAGGCPRADAYGDYRGGHIGRDCPGSRPRRGDPPVPRGHPILPLKLPNWVVTATQLDSRRYPTGQ